MFIHLPKGLQEIMGSYQFNLINLVSYDLPHQFPESRKSLANSLSFLTVRRAAMIMTAFVFIHLRINHLYKSINIFYRCRRNRRADR